MNKQEFLQKLQGRLAQTLNREQVEQNVEYYSNYIDEQVRNGKSEEEVLEQLGNPLLIAKTIMDTQENQEEFRSAYEEQDMENGQNGRSIQIRTNSKWPLIVAAAVILLILWLILKIVGSVLSLVILV